MASGTKERDIHDSFHRHDGQRLFEEGRPRHAGFCLYRTDLCPDPPVRPGAGEDGMGDSAVEAFSRHFITTYGVK